MMYELLSFNPVGASIVGIPEIYRVNESKNDIRFIDRIMQ